MISTTVQHESLTMTSAAPLASSPCIPLLPWTPMDQDFSQNHWVSPFPLPVIIVLPELCLQIQKPQSYLPLLSLITQLFQHWINIFLLALLRGRLCYFPGLKRLALKAHYVRNHVLLFQSFFSSTEDLQWERDWGWCNLYQLRVYGSDQFFFISPRDLNFSIPRAHTISWTCKLSSLPIEL